MKATERLRDMAVRHGVYLERYTRQEARELEAVLEKSIKELTDKIDATGGKYTKRWLKSMLDDTKAVLSETRKAMESKLFSDAKELADYELERVGKDFRYFLPIEVASPNPSQLYASIKDLPAAAGSTLGDLFAKWELNTVQNVTSAIRLGIAQGETTDQIVRRIRGRATGKRGVYEGGILQTSTKGAQAITRTMVAHVNAQARKEFYNENADLLKGYQYTAALDARTCLVCAPLDGKVYGMDEPKPEVPQHYNCRCLYIPVLKSWEELGIDLEEAPAGTRASMNGQVPDTLTYKDWLKQQSKEVQDDVLGPGRAAMFRAGTPLTDMRDRQGNVLTLAQLKELDK